ncbi:hypothetical protein STXM2123_3926 [Streptomyces sp. F-3]|uniref:DUF2993 domain-containing protein n=1 Tax=Streptomyces thermogriseus TaxID=75292 RepID=A0ABN1T511_9ACTN|nr:MULTISPECIES: DUF2993 domain-containing protein [Streptomyces]MDN5382767.1 DUF2993 domain-containing protein [Streptomyces sp. LB8]GAT83225.1 hypothetical protein STXM2123_3926 [Streptomyces sp. F-3]
MRALRILLIVAVVLGLLFVAVDRIAVHFAEDQAADRLRTTENLASTPEVSINGFPFLTQVASGELDDIKVGIESYEASTGKGEQKIRIDDLEASMKGVRFSDGYRSATASEATGTALIAYDELLKAAKSESTQIAPGVTSQVVGLSDGGNGKIKVDVVSTILGNKVPSTVFSSVTVRDNKVRVQAEGLPEFGGVQLAEDRIRSVTDFQQTIDQLPGGIRLDSVKVAKDGLEITVKGSNVRLAG